MGRRRERAKDRVLAIWDGATYLFWRGVLIASDSLYWL